MAEQLPKMILLQRGEQEKSFLDDYYNGIAERAVTLQQNLAPYDDTINRANESMNRIDEELDALYERAGALEQQRAELLDVVDDTHKSRAKIMGAHGNALIEFNAEFFARAAKEYNVKELADKSKGWNIDLQYYPTFGTIYISEEVADAQESIIPDDDDGTMSGWMDNITK